MRKLVIRTALAALAAVLALGSFCGCVHEPADPVWTEEPTEEPVEMRDISNDSNLADSILFANQAANVVQARYLTGARDKYEIFNGDVRIVETLDTDGKLGLESIENRSGGTYFTNSMNVYVVDKNGKVWQDNYSTTVGRINTTRLGYYYYEVFLRDQGFGTEENGSCFYANERSLSSFDNDWGASSDCSASYDKGKSVTMTLNGGMDPYLVRRLERAVPMDRVTHIAITIAVEGSGGRANFFFYDKKSKDFNATQMINFDLACDGKPHTYLVDISKLLKDDLCGIRLDAGRMSGEKYTISDVRAVTVGDCVNAVGERTLDVFPDKLHQSFRLLARDGYEAVTELGMIWEMPEDTVEAVRIRDKDGVHEDLSFDENTVQYLAFKVKNAGVIGIIIPDDGTTSKVSVALENGKYVVKQVAGGKLELKAGQDARFGHRIYTEASGSFDKLDTVAWLERNPLPKDSFTVNKGSNGTKIEGYDTLKGLYNVSMKGTTFPEAYSEKHRNDYYMSNITANADSNDRTVYMRVRSTPGTLECAAMLDENDMLVPVPMQVCKNFDCEKEEAVYDPEDKSFGDSIFPLVLNAGKSISFTDTHLYMNWGKYQLSQLSSIQFFVSYYHLSKGVSESNCISFYGVFGKDGFLLPDFRGHSGIMWQYDPQYTSVATSKATSYFDNKGNRVMPEYTGAKINSSGPVYADLEYSYISDCGSFKYTLRHEEFPHNDENRTYYTLKITFLKDLTLNDVRSQFTLLYQDSRDQTFSEMSYLSPDGTHTKVALDTSGNRDRTQYKLKGDAGYYTYFHSNREVPKGKITTETDPMNYAVVIKKTEFVIGGKTWTGDLILRDSFCGGSNFSELSLDLGKTTFKRGDTLYMEFLMLPWASRDIASDANVITVYEDSVLKPLKVINVAKGTVVDEPYLARVLCDNGEAEFTVTGGRSRNVVRVDGFTKLGRISIEEILPDGTVVPYDTAVKEFDGYEVSLGRDGTYSYSFVYEAETPDTTRTFRVSVK